MTSNAYLQGTECDLAKQQNIKFEDHFFPYSLNTSQYFNYEGCIPNFEYFINFNDSEDEIRKKRLFYESKKDSQWRFQTEIIKTTLLSVELLCKSMCTFIVESFNLQKSLKLNLKIENQNFKKCLHPFQSNISSMPSFIYKVFQAFFLFNEDLFCVMNEYGMPTRNSSKFEFNCSKFLDFEHPEKLYRFNFNHPKGQKYFAECIPDLFSEKEKEAVFLNGCYFHGHLNCLDNPNSSLNSTNFTKKNLQRIE